MKNTATTILIGIFILVCSSGSSLASAISYKCGPLMDGGLLRWAPDEDKDFIFKRNVNKKIPEWAFVIEIDGKTKQMDVSSPKDKIHPRNRTHYRIVYQNRAQVTAMAASNIGVEFYTLYAGGRLVYTVHSNWDNPNFDSAVEGGLAQNYYATCELTK
jgi:hypothetical protein